MKNDLFKAKTAFEKRKKLDVVLRQMTGDRLTESERRVIGKAVGHCRQYRLTLCRSPDILYHCIAPDDGVFHTRTIFGDLNKHPESPSAVLVQWSDMYSVYIYLPAEKEEPA